MNSKIRVEIITAQQLKEMCKKTGWTVELIKTVIDANNQYPLGDTNLHVNGKG